MEKTPVDAVYRADSFCCRFFWVLREAKMGAKRWSRALMEAIYLADPLAVKMGAIWAILGVKSALLGSKMGTP